MKGAHCSFNVICRAFNSYYCREEGALPSLMTDLRSGSRLTLSRSYGRDQIWILASYSKSKTLSATSGCAVYSLKGLAPQTGRSHNQYLGVSDKYCVALTDGSWVLRVKQWLLVEFMIIQVHIDSAVLCAKHFTLSRLILLTALWLSPFYGGGTRGYVVSHTEQVLSEFFIEKKKGVTSAGSSRCKSGLEQEGQRWLAIRTACGQSWMPE